MHKPFKSLLFPMGSLIITSGVSKIMMNAAVDPLDYFARHARGDWGEIEPTEVADNLRAIDVGDRILSEYEVNHTRIWVITEADRSCTTILLPEEY